MLLQREDFLIILRFMIASQFQRGNIPLIYLDNAATTRPCPEAVEAMARALTETWGNPSATHAPGRAARALLEESRKAVM